MTHYVLPDLPYDYGALEPHISGKIMELRRPFGKFARRMGVGGTPACAGAVSS